MPLTLPTHPVAVLPLKLWRPRWFDGVALVVGAAAPDVGYATYGFGGAILTHNPLALLWWSLPVTLVAARLIRWAAPVVAAHLPGGGPLRLRDYGVLGTVRHPWFVTVLSALLGALSHLVWDAVTHPGYLTGLQREVWPGTPWWGLLSDASNLAGFAAGTFLLLQIGRRQLLRQWHGSPPPVRRQPFAFWPAVAAALATGLALVVAFPVDWMTGQAIRLMLITGLALLCGAATAGRASRRPMYRGHKEDAHTAATVLRVQWGADHDASRSALVRQWGGIMVMESDSIPGIGRRQLFRWGGLTAAGVAAAGMSLVDTEIADADSAGHDRIPPDTRPGGAYDRYVAQLAAAGKFSGVVLLTHRGRTVLSRSYGMADRAKGIHNHEGIAFTLSSAGKPFNAIAVLQLAQQGRLRLTDPVGRFLKGFDADVAEKVTIHHMLSGTSGMNTPDEDIRRIFTSRHEVHDYQQRWARRSKLVGVPGVPNAFHAGAETAIPAMIVEVVSGKSYWDYVEENIFRRCGMTGSAFYTRPQWLTDAHIAHPYMTLADGSHVDAVRNLDKGSPYEYILDRNPGRAFIDAVGDGGFATAPDLVRFARALHDGTLLDRPWADVLTAAKISLGPASFGTYGPSAEIIGGQWAIQRAGGNPGVCANWTIYPDSDWVAIILANCDDVPLPQMIGREMQAITGAAPGAGGGG
jgi:CubicO group peptidase (beta-lactamase class C family)